MCPTVFYSLRGEANSRNLSWVGEYPKKASPRAQIGGGQYAKVCGRQLSLGSRGKSVHVRSAAWKSLQSIDRWWPPPPSYTHSRFYNEAEIKPTRVFPSPHQVRLMLQRSSEGLAHFGNTNSQKLE